jgi:hypothetical protein
MAKEHAYQAAMSAMSIYAGLFKAIEDDVGLDKALEYHGKQGEPFGIMIGETLKQQLGDKAPTIEAIKSITKPSMESFGFDPEIEESPTKLSFKIQRCPFYAGFQMAGLDHEKIGKMCNVLSSTEFTQLKKYYPNIEGNMNFRDSSESYCLETFTLK